MVFLEDKKKVNFGIRKISGPFYFKDKLLTLENGEFDVTDLPHAERWATHSGTYMRNGTVISTYDNKKEDTWEKKEKKRYKVFLEALAKTFCDDSGTNWLDSGEVSKSDKAKGVVGYLLHDTNVNIKGLTTTWDNKRRKWKVPVTTHEMFECETDIVKLDDHKDSTTVLSSLEEEDGSILI